jgi:isoleucyl-tRNA synthetase
VLAKKDGKEETLWMAEPLVAAVLKKGRYKEFSILEKKQGAELKGWIYDSPLHAQVPLQREFEHRVTTADFVALENTGMVHIAPGHGWTIMCSAQKRAAGCLPVSTVPVNSAKRAGVFAGQFVRGRNENVLVELGEYLFAKETVTHRYGHCMALQDPDHLPGNLPVVPEGSEDADLMLSEVAKVTWYPNGPAVPRVSMDGSRKPGTGACPASGTGASPYRLGLHEV